ncbi:Metallo-hydrolase/oxidoreductase [Hyaloscypha variabilis F]|uniref:Metallo-hydrolase/oxidoreductase n=1 Tax=Hyaloscypha variabilis (strain UAMH 11265 / GT02V1 / F) TaxID=1149755 RepID=A0A2J6RB05_HYAVF|nr:Metallo-hydrolase/oxidoreductase [Hyaloscypha variabilis F]
MSSIFVKQQAPPSPPLETTLATVTVHALSAGHLTLPERHFVSPASDTARSTVPSLSFLIQHEDSETRKKTRIVFDLGLRRNLERYSEPIQQHAATRRPISTSPDVVKSLAAGGLTPDDIDFVVYSHVHWDHIGEPRDFNKSTFIVGSGATSLLQGSSTSLRGGHSFFEADLLPESRTIELPSPSSQPPQETSLGRKPSTPDFHQPWTTHLNLLHVMDIFLDGSLYIVDAPGHLPGHINLLARTSPNSYIYLAGDACHDRRIMRKEREIGTWADAEGFTCCIHANREKAEETIKRIGELERSGVEVIFAHDVEWEQDPRNEGSEHCSQHFKMSSLTPAQTSLKETYISTLGPSSWTPGCESLLKLSPEMLKASLHMSSVPKKKSHLPPKIQSLIALSVSSASTHLYIPGIHTHIRAALSSGATQAEIMEVLELTSTLGIHACNIGVPMLCEVMRELGGYEEYLGREEDEQRRRLREEFTEKRGYWHAFWEDFLRLDPEFFAAYLEFSTVPWVKDVKGDGKGGGVLEPKIKELIYCAFDVAATHLYQPGLKLHMRNALGYGATPEEIMEVLEIATLLSIHTLEVATPVLEQYTEGKA